jgi:hypothetical protein
MLLLCLSDNIQNVCRNQLIVLKMQKQHRQQMSDFLENHGLLFSEATYLVLPNKITNKMEDKSNVP